MKALLFHGIAILDDSDELSKFMKEKRDHAPLMEHFNERYAAISDDSKLTSKSHRVSGDDDGQKKQKKQKVCFDDGAKFKSKLITLPPNEGLLDVIYQNIVCWLKIFQEEQHTKKDNDALEKAATLLTRMA